MKARLCLHGAGIRHQAQLLGLAKKLLPACQARYKVKEKHFPDNDMYKCRIARFAPRGGGREKAAWRASCAWGTLLAGDKPVPVADVCWEYDAADGAAAAAVRGMAEKILAGKQHFVVDEPDFSERLALLRGTYYLEKLPAYDARSAATALRCHLPWQIYAINKSWEQLLACRGARRCLWRQLRVKLRRLRSFLALAAPLLPGEELARQRELLRARAKSLSCVREYDVLLQACSRFGMESPNAAPLPRLESLLEEKRAAAAEEALAQLRLGELTLEAARLLLFLQAEGEKRREESLEAFFRRRLHAWAAKLRLLPQECRDARDMEKLHRARIKLKRFRYALQSIPEIKTEPRLLRSLKNLQDALGLLHDVYVNDLHLSRLAAEHPELDDLHTEIAMLRGWEREKAGGALEALERQWEEFARALSDSEFIIPY